MFATLLTVALFVLPIIPGVLADFHIVNPTLVQCQDAPIKWDQTTGPYNLIVVSAADQCGDALFNLGDHASNHMTWNKVPLVAGTQVMLSVEDSHTPNPDEAWTGVITVGHSNDVSCLPPNLQASAAANAALNPSSTADPAATGPAIAAGAANQGLGQSSAPSLRQISIPALTVSAIIGTAALLL